jgi:hypothetical protein
MLVESFAVENLGTNSNESIMPESIFFHEPSHRGALRLKTWKSILTRILYELLTPWKFTMARPSQVAFCGI